MVFGIFFVELAACTPSLKVSLSSTTAFVYAIVWLPAERGCSSTSWFSLRFEFLLLQVLQFSRKNLSVKYTTSLYK